MVLIQLDTNTMFNKIKKRKKNLIIGRRSLFLINAEFRIIPRFKR